MCWAGRKTFSLLQMLSLLWDLEYGSFLTVSAVEAQWLICSSLCMSEQVQFKIAVLAYKSCTDTCRYTSVTSLTSLAVDLCSPGTSRLILPPIRLWTVANQAFSVVSPQIWNNLPANAESLSTFHLRLKTHPFWSYFLYKYIFWLIDLLIDKYFNCNLAEVLKLK